VPPASRYSARALAGGLALALGLASTVLFLGAGPASASTPRSQAVGRFLDGSAGGSPLESAVDVKDARASNPGTVTDQNPLDVELGGQGDVPMTGKAQLPGSGNAIHFGAANQVAKALSNGYSYGAAGAVANSGGVSAGGNNQAFPADATIDLSAASFPAPPVSLPLPGAGGAAALGGVTAKIGAVSALASTPVGGKPASTDYNIGSLTLSIGSPAFGNVLQQLAAALVPPTPPAGLPVQFPASCGFAAQALPPLSIAGGAVTIDPITGTITIDVEALLSELGLDINKLPANTDLLAAVLGYLTSPTGLGKGIQDAIGNTLATQQSNFVTCTEDISAAFPAPLNGVVKTAYKQFSAGQKQITKALNQTIAKLAGAGGADPLKPLTDGLKSGLQIGVNVQPNGAKGSYASPLSASPDQADPAVDGQTVVRAIEIDLGGGQLSLAMANAAAGPFVPAAAPATPSSVAPTSPAPAPNTQIPTGVPAGQGTHSAAPALPVVLLVLALVVGAAGVLSWRIGSGRH
jgi:hypothetical protein